MNDTKYKADHSVGRVIIQNGMKSTGKYESFSENMLAQVWAYVFVERLYLYTKKSFSDFTEGGTYYMNLAASLRRFDFGQLTGCVRKNILSSVLGREEEIMRCAQ